MKMKYKNTRSLCPLPLPKCGSSRPRVCRLTEFGVQERDPRQGDCENIYGGDMGSGVGTVF